MRRVIHTQFRYQEADIPFDIHLSSGTQSVQMWLFLGTVQIGKLPQWVANMCPPGVAIVAGAEHWRSADDGSDTPEFLLAYTLGAMEELQKQFGTPTAIIAESQSTSSVILQCTEHNILPRQLILIQPLGLTSRVFMEKPDPYRELLRRARINLRHQMPTLTWDYRLIYNYILLSYAAKPRSTKARSQYLTGLALDVVPELARLARLINITIVSGENDKVFPASELQQSLKGAGICNIPIVQVARTPHAPLHTYFGKRLLVKALEIANTHRVARRMSGASKLKKAESYGTKIINEKELL